jgi:hypothetical protein
MNYLYHIWMLFEIVVFLGQRVVNTFLLEWCINRCII